MTNQIQISENFIQSLILLSTLSWVIMILFSTLNWVIMILNWVKMILFSTLNWVIIMVSFFSVSRKNGREKNQPVCHTFLFLTGVFVCFFNFFVPTIFYTIFIISER